jgi:hypothetical protein
LTRAVPTTAVALVVDGVDSDTAHLSFAGSGTAPD